MDTASCSISTWAPGPGSASMASRDRDIVIQGVWSADCCSIITWAPGPWGAGVASKDRDIVDQGVATLTQKC